MSKKTNSISLRLKKTNRDYNHCWYADILYGDVLSQCYKIENLLLESLKSIAVFPPKVSIIGAYKKANLLFCYLESNTKKSLSEGLNIKKIDLKSSTKSKGNNISNLPFLSSRAKEAQEEEHGRVFFNHWPPTAIEKKNTPSAKIMPTTGEENSICNSVAEDKQSSVTHSLQDLEVLDVFFAGMGKPSRFLGQQGSYPATQQTYNSLKTKGHRYKKKNFFSFGPSTQKSPILEFLEYKTSFKPETSKILYKNRPVGLFLKYFCEKYCTKKGQGATVRDLPWPCPPSWSTKLTTDMKLDMKRAMKFVPSNKPTYNFASQINKRKYIEKPLRENKDALIKEEFSNPRKDNCWITKKNKSKERKKKITLFLNKQNFFLRFFDISKHNNTLYNSDKFSVFLPFKLKQNLLFSVVCIFGSSLYKVFGKKEKNFLINNAIIQQKSSKIFLNELHNIITALYYANGRVAEDNGYIVRDKNKTENYIYTLYNSLCCFWGNPVSISLIKSKNEKACALFLAHYVAYFLERKVLFRRIKKLLFSFFPQKKNSQNKFFDQFAKNYCIAGIRISCSGRVGGRSKKAQRSRKENFMWGETGLHVFSSKLDFAKTYVETSFGIVGVQVWICYK